MACECVTAAAPSSSTKQHSNSAYVFHLMLLPVVPRPQATILPLLLSGYQTNSHSLVDKLLACSLGAAARCFWLPGDCGGAWSWQGAADSAH